ncbi:MAG: 23S rRNA (uracil(1939)-C(5))-methyltransferase RlmD [Gammaproteobacteria bacterium]
MSRRIKKLTPGPTEASIESLSHEGRGMVHIAGKAVFIDGALPGEKVLFRYTRRHSRYDEGIVTEVCIPAEKRVEAKCPHFGQCGGCSLQHLLPQEQIQHKQRVLLDQLKHIGGVQPEITLPAVTGPLWGYRHKARLGVKYVMKKEKLLVGFREKQSRFMAGLSGCQVLNPRVGTRIPALQELIRNLSIYDRIPQIEVAVGDRGTALVLRHLQSMTEADLQKLKIFQTDSGISLFLQAKGPDSVVPLDETTDTYLSYRLDRYDLVFRFYPTDFTQINFAINRFMIDRVMELLEPEERDSILDLFCGLGNFSLPLAKHSRQVTGIDSAEGLLERARQNAHDNNIGNVTFHGVDLMQKNGIEADFLNNPYRKILLDPPRSGAREILGRLDLDSAENIVYVSCNPSTLARDAGFLVNARGFRLKQAGVMDMFPHTAHIESIASFQR